MDLIEKVARAITVAEGDDPDGNAGSLLNESEVWWQHRVPQARAAIEAIVADAESCGVCGCAVYKGLPTALGQGALK